MGRRYSKISGVTLIDCDSARQHAPDEQFRSASIPKVIAEQLQLAGWTIMEVSTGKKLNVGRALVDEKRTIYLCPRCKPAGRMSGGPPPLSVGGRTSH
jgi:hypothetical protein